MVVTLQQERINQNNADMKEELTLAGNALYDNESMKAVLTNCPNGCGHMTAGTMHGAQPATRAAKAAGRLGACTARRTAAKAAARLVAPVAGYYSRVLGEKVSTRQTLLLLNAQAAFVMAVLPADGPLAGRALCVAWLAHALLLCRRSGLRTSC